MEYANRSTVCSWMDNRISEWCGKVFIVLVVLHVHPVSCVPLRRLKQLEPAIELNILSFVLWPFAGKEILSEIVIQCIEWKRFGYLLGRNKGSDMVILFRRRWCIKITLSS